MDVDPLPRLQFRPARLDDVEAVVALVQSAYRGEESREGWTTEADLVEGSRTDAGEVAAVVGADRSMMLLAEAGGELVGCCRVEARPQRTAYLGMFAVRPRRQGQGAGRALIAEAERRASAEWGATTMTLSVIRQRSDLLAWYDRLGYRLTGETAPFPYDDPTDVPLRPDLEFVILAKPLPGGGRPG